MKMSNRLLYAVFFIFLLASHSTYAAQGGASKQKLSDLECTVDQIAQFDGTVWKCAYLPSDSMQYQIVDADGIPWGDIVFISDANWVYAETDWFGESIVVSVARNYTDEDGLWFRVGSNLRYVKVLFDDAGCNGQGYVAFSEGIGAFLDFLESSDIYANPHASGREVTYVALVGFDENQPFPEKVGAAFDYQLAPDGVCETLSYPYTVPDDFLVYGFTGMGDVIPLPTPPYKVVVKQ